MSEEKKLLSIAKVCDRISFSKSWIYSEMKAGRFPKPDLQNAGGGARNKNLWLNTTIDRYIAELIKNGKHPANHPVGFPMRRSKRAHL